MPNGDGGNTTLEDVRQGTGPGNPPPPPTDAAAGLGTSQPPPVPAQQPQPWVSPAATGLTLSPQDAKLAAMKADSYGSKVYHGILSALGGSNDISYSVDPATGRMVQSVAASGPGTQWKRIISGALTGYAAGAGMKGPGSTSAKFGAGIQAGTQQAQQRDQQQRQQASEDFEREQKLATSNLQNSLLAHNIARSAFELKDQQLTANEREINSYGEWRKMIGAGGEGSQMIGHYPTEKEAYEALNANPALHDHLVKGEISMHYTVENGEIHGVDAAVVTPTWLQSKYNQPFHIKYNDIGPDGKPRVVDREVPPGTYTNDEINKMSMGLAAQHLEERHKEVTEQREGEVAKGTEAKDYAGAAESRATAAKTEFETEYGKEHGEFPGTEGKGGGLIISPEDMPATVKAVGEGRVSMPTLGRMLAKNPTLAEEITKVYPDFREGMVKTADKQQLEFTSGKTGGSLNASGTSVQHLSQLLKLNTAASHIPGTPAYREYMIQVHQAAEELSKFYGGGKAAQTDIQNYEKLLGGIGPGRDQALTRAVTALGEKMTEYHQQWQNAMPSQYWSMPMPGISQTADDQLAALSPEYAAQRKTWTRGAPTPTSTATPNQPQVNTTNTPHAAPPGTQLPPEALPHLKAAMGKPMRMTAPDGTDYGIWQINQAGQPVRVGN